MKAIIYLAILYGGVSTHLACQDQNNSKDHHPNIILLMADDMGWGDVGFNGNKEIKTPGLDRLASNGVVLDRFYSASPVCSPTRGSCITGRNPFRYGIYSANQGFMKKEEITIAEVLREFGYTTGHFGKWHLGALSDSLPDGRRGGKGTMVFSPPWDNGFDVCFSTEQAVPTWNPTKHDENALLSFPMPTRYWKGYNKYATDNLEGDDSRVMMDWVVPFINKAVDNKQPFLAVVWFHTPHSPVVAGEHYRKMYSQYDENKQHYYGCITAMDEQIDRLQNELKRLGIEKNTLIFFTSDNGPAGEGGGVRQHPGGRQQGITGGFRGRKGSLYEGGVRVPAIFSWPQKLEKGNRLSYPAVTSDYFPTILAILGIDLPKRPYDGINIFPALLGEIDVREEYIGFQTPTHVSLVSQQHKLLVKDTNTKEYDHIKEGELIPEKPFELYNLINDKYETEDISEHNPSIVESMNNVLIDWINSCKRSDKGKDYVNITKD